MSTDVHHEIELVVALGRRRDIPIEHALDHVWGYGVGLDMTRRDLQGEAKKLGRPWEIGKAFERSAPDAADPRQRDRSPGQGAVTLTVNGELRQAGDLNQMIWKVPEMIAYLSEHFELAAGDLIMTGTPSGVGPVRPGDAMVAHVEGVDEVSFKVV